MSPLRERCRQLFLRAVAASRGASTLAAAAREATPSGILMRHSAAGLTRSRWEASRRCYQASPSVFHGSKDDEGAEDRETISVTFITRDGTEETVQAPIGENLLEVAHANDIELEGACEGSLACSTCHVVVEQQELYDTLPEPDDDENDMLDLAFGLTETSRLGCQIIATKDIDGLRVRIPAATRNMAVDGYVPKPH